MKKTLKKFAPLSKEDFLNHVVREMNERGGLLRKKSALEQMINASSDMTMTPSDDYSGVFMAQFLEYIIQGESLMSKGCVTTVDGVKLRETEYDVKVPMYFGDRTNTFDGDGRDLTFSPIQYTTIPVKMMRDIENQDLVGTGLEMSYGRGMNNEAYLPAVVRDAILNYLQQRMPLEFEKLHIMGKARAPIFGFTRAYAGFEGELLASSLSKKVTTASTPIVAITNVGGFIAYEVGTGLASNFEVGDLIEARGIGNGTGNAGTKLNSNIYALPVYDPENPENIFITDIDVANDILITNVNITNNAINIAAPVYTTAKLYYLNNNNIVNYLTNVWQRIPTPVRNSGQAKIWVHDYQWNQFALNQGNRLGFSLTKQQEKMLLDMQIVPLTSISPNTVIAVTPENARVVYDEIGEESYIKYRDMEDYNFDKQTRLEVQARINTKIPKPSEAVILAPM